jgi:hypothetical protein
VSSESGKIHLVRYKQRKFWPFFVSSRFSHLAAMK